MGTMCCTGRGKSTRTHHMGRRTSPSAARVLTGRLTARAQGILSAGASAFWAGPKMRRETPHKTAQSVAKSTMHVARQLGTTYGRLALRQLASSRPPRGHWARSLRKIVSSSILLHHPSRTRRKSVWAPAEQLCKPTKQFSERAFTTALPGMLPKRNLPAALVDLMLTRRL